jgi:hypothetical protein
VSRSLSSQACNGGAKVISFFITRDVADRNQAVNVFNSLAYQLAILVPSARSSILAALREDERLTDCALTERIQKLLIHPLKTLTSPKPIVFVTDALDECTESDRQIMHQALVVLLRGICALPAAARVKLFITSRMDHWIQRIFNNALPDATQSARNLRLHELAHGEVQHDIETYFEDVFSRIRQEHPDGESLSDWPTAEEKTRLVAKTGVLFIYASTVSRFLRYEGLSPRKSLHAILHADAGGNTSDPYKELDSLYLQVLSSSLGGYSHHSLIQRVIATVVLAAVPLTIELLGDFIGEDANAAVRSLSSLLLVPEPTRASQDPV